LLDTQPAAEAGGSTGLFENVPAPAILFDRRGNVVYLNGRAKLLFDSQDAIAIRNDRIVVPQSMQATFDRSRARVIGDTWSNKLRLGEELLVRRPEDTSSLICVLTPIGADNAILQWATPIRCAMFVIDERLGPEASLRGRLQRLFGLTGAETDICLSLASGLKIHEIARQRGTSVQTIRTQLAASLAKTHTRRQSELSALVTRLRG
jgi:DNA-binding CsgD family transcriptional regulator